MTDATSPIEPVIAHLLPWTELGGTEYATLRIANALRDRGFTSIALCRSDAPQVQKLFREAGYAVATFKPVQLSLRRPLLYLRNQLRIARKLRRHRATILHCADVMGAVYGATAGRIARLRVVSHVRNAVPALPLYDRLCILPVQDYVFVSKETRQTFAVRVKRGRVLYDGISIIPASPALRATARRDMGFASTARVVGMVARLAPQKDYLALARAAQRVLSIMPDVRFVVVGDTTGVYRAHYDTIRTTLDQLGIAESFTFTGHRADARQLMSAFDVFVLSTHFEGLPLVILEAMAIGLPTIATAVNGIPEVVAHPGVGALFPRRDDAALAQHILALLTDPPAARAIGDAAREFVAQHFSEEAFANGLINLYT
jgi:glycosyltransferase involved in cell wall biosynthesis